MPKPGPKVVNRFLEALWSAKGSDLMLTAGSPPLIRVDGLLQPIEGEDVLHPAETEKLVLGVLGEELAERFHKMKQLDFSFSWGDRARLRGNAFLQRGTAALVLRMIPFEIPSFAELGLPPIVKEWASFPHGFVLVTGPTGSGKSTTLASMINHINATRALHILTIEDPIEYVHHHQVSAVNQREVGSDADTFTTALRAALREDPDVVLIGEMRDAESIAAALTIAETGHLVLATLHTNDTAQSIDRIVDVFPGDQQPQIRLQLAQTLIGIINQQLVPRIGGGRIAAFEILVGTYGVRNLIREGKTRQMRNAELTGQRDGMQTLEMSLVDLVERGLVTVDDAAACSLFPQEVRNPRKPEPAPVTGKKR